MEHGHIIAALRAKRDTLADELRQVEERAAALRGDMLTIDDAIRIFDPNNAPQARPKPARTASHGQFSRAVLDTLRRAAAPMSCRQIAEQVAAKCGIDASTTHAMNLLTNRVRGTLARKRIGLVSEQRGDTILWRVV